jgi:hypothetical protein
VSRRFYWLILQVGAVVAGIVAGVWLFNTVSL